MLVEDAALARLVALPSGKADDLRRVAATIAHFLTVTLTVAPIPRGASGVTRRRYLRWLWDRVVSPRLRADPDLESAVVEQVKDLLLTAHELLRDAPQPLADVDAQTDPRQANGAVDADTLALVDVIVQAVCEEVPGVIGALVREDVEFMTRIGAGARPMVVMSGVGFDPNEFWPAEASAVNGREVVLRALEPDADFTLRPHVEVDRPTFCFAHPANGGIIVFISELAGLLLESHQERESALQRLRPRLDRPSRTFGREAAELLAAGPGERVEIVQRWLSLSVTEHLLNVRERFAVRQQLSWTDLLPPSSDGLRRHFRLEGGIREQTSHVDVYNAITHVLVEDEGLDEAFARLAGLPVPLPAILLDRIAALPADLQNELVKRLVKAASSPLSRIHVVRLLFHHSSGKRSYGRLARRILRKLLNSQGVVACEAFLGLVVRVHDELNLRPEVRAWPTADRLSVAWGYAHHLFSTLVSAGAQVDGLKATFAGSSGIIPVDWFERQMEVWSDASHPRRSTPATFLLAGVAYAPATRAVHSSTTPSTRDLPVGCWRNWIGEWSRRWRGCGT